MSEGPKGGRQGSGEGEHREQAAWSGFPALPCVPMRPETSLPPLGHPSVTAHSPASINVQVL